MLPATGSTSTAASPSPQRSTAPATASRSLYGQTIVSAVAPAGTPGVEGMPKVAGPEPALDEERVRMAVVAAGELEDPVAVREAARQPTAAHRRLRAGRDEPHFLDGGHRLCDLLGQLDLALRRDAERRPVGRRLLHRLDDLRVGVAEYERAPRHHPVDVAGAAASSRYAPSPRRGEERLAAPHRVPRAHGRVDAARDHLARAAEETGLQSPFQSHSASSRVQ